MTKNSDSQVEKQTVEENSSMDRRTFLKRSALAGVAGLAASVTPVSLLGASAKKKNETTQPDEEQIHNFKFNPNGKFKILQLTDTHYLSGDPVSERAAKNVVEMLDTELPDLVIHTGDVIYGEPAEASLREILGLIAERGIPFAVTLGNHDEEYDKTRQEVFDIIRSIPYNINTPVKDLHGVSNEIITLSSSTDETIKWVFYLFDTGRHCELPDLGGYDYVHFDQISWYRNHSQAFTKVNGGAPIPSLAFMHIPIPEYNDAIRNNTHCVMRGNFGEKPYTPDVNSGLFVSMKEMGDVQAVICGHDHDNDYIMRWGGICLMFGRFSGCDTVYNSLRPNGARIIELSEDEEGFTSWIRVYSRGTTQYLAYPEDFYSVL